jgi:hypothetical protein
MDLFPRLSGIDRDGWRRWLNAAQGSATILWAKFCIFVGALAGLLSQAADYLGDPSVSQAIQSRSSRNMWRSSLIFVSVVSIWARKRTL